MTDLACRSDFQPQAGTDEDHAFASASGTAVTHPDIVAILDARRRRADFFSPGLFADPAWDMLLALYNLELNQQSISVSKLCMSAGVPLTTALRWIAKLESDGLVRREDDPLDGRRSWVELTDAGSCAMRGYFSEIRPTSVL